MRIQWLKVPTFSKQLVLALAALLATGASAKCEVATPPLIEAPAACGLTLGDKLPSDGVYAIRGTYMDDAHHGAFMEIPKCDVAIYPKLGEDAVRTISNYHQAFSEKCGVTLRGDIISGLFTGRFERGERVFYGLNSRNGSRSSIMVNFFVITGIESDDLDVQSIKCPS